MAYRPGWTGTWLASLACWVCTSDQDSGGVQNCQKDGQLHAVDSNPYAGAKCLSVLDTAVLALHRSCICALCRLRFTRT
ncbi:hypothetical protein F5883DRAFT_25738 [Diaporthe sp. PMI_573]|nr:hypothetical protein F5883DRAFT_25738 [Diaporthaceae sp. PMI_573]